VVPGLPRSTRLALPLRGIYVIRHRESNLSPDQVSEVEKADSEKAQLISWPELGGEMTGLPNIFD
jgi:hypothetical protein